VREGWTPDEYIDAIVRMIDGDNRPPEAVAVPKLEELQVIEKSLTDLVRRKRRAIV